MSVTTKRDFPTDSPWWIENGLNWFHSKQQTQWLPTSRLFGGRAGPARDIWMLWAWLTILKWVWNTNPIEIATLLKWLPMSSNTKPEERTGSPDTCSLHYIRPVFWSLKPRARVFHRYWQPPEGNTAEARPTRMLEILWGFFKSTFPFFAFSLFLWIHPVSPTPFCCSSSLYPSLFHDDGRKIFIPTREY